MNPAEPNLPAPDTDEPASVPSRVVVVLGAKGGVGTTLVAAHLAAQLAARRFACLVDLDEGKGDVAAWLGLRSGRSLNLLFDAIDHLDASLVKGSVEEHPSGLNVLAQPYDLTQLHHFTADEVNRLLRVVRELYEDVVIDAGSRVSVAGLTCAMAATHVLLVLEPEIVALRDSLRTLNLLRRLGVDDAHVHLVLNHLGAPYALPVDDVEAQLKRPVLAELTHDPAAAAQATLRGVLLDEVAPRAPLTTDLHRLGALLHGQPTVPERRGFWPWSR